MLEEAAKFKKFPTTLIGIRDHEYEIGDSKGIALERPGIIVLDDEVGWREYIIMMPDGLYHLAGNIFVQTKEGKPVKYTYCPGPLFKSTKEHICLGVFPNWESRKERPLDYLIYGENTLRKMKKLLVNQEVSG